VRQRARAGLGDHVTPHGDYGEDGIRATRRVGKSPHSSYLACSVGLGMQGLQAKIEKILEQL